jgi:tRNA U54 and U55 pseudouridine synthase Pus10
VLSVDIKNLSFVYRETTQNIKTKNKKITGAWVLPHAPVTVLLFK